MKSVKLKQIAITLFGLLGLLCLGGYISSKIHGGGIEPVEDLISNVIKHLIQGEKLDLLTELKWALTDTLLKHSQLAFSLMYKESFVPTVLYALVIQLRELGMMGGELFFAVPFVLIPVAAWLKNKRWAGLIAFVGLLGASVGMVVMALSNGWNFWVTLGQYGFEPEDLFDEFVSSVMLLIYVCALTIANSVVYWLAAAGFLLLAVTALFGYRPALLFPLGAVMVLPAVGMMLGNILAGGFVLFQNYMGNYDYVCWEFAYRCYGQNVLKSLEGFSQLKVFYDFMVGALNRALLTGGIVTFMTMAIGLLPTLNAQPLIGKKWTNPNKKEDDCNERVNG